MMQHRGDAATELARAFRVAPELLERCATILDLQRDALAREPPAPSLPDAVRLAAAARLRSGEPVIPRGRIPLETRRVLPVMRALSRALMPDAVAMEDSVAELLEAALPAILEDDAAGVAQAASRLSLPESASAAILREALKPEMLRVTTPFRALVGDAPRPARCPLCGDRASCGSEPTSRVCCRWCGMLWTWDLRTCGACGSTDPRAKELTTVVKHATLMQCASCAEIVPLFDAPADPLLLSLHAVLIAPFDLAARIEGRATPTAGFAVF